MSLIMNLKTYIQKVVFNVLFQMSCFIVPVIIDTIKHLIWNKKCTTNNDCLQTNIEPIRPVSQFASVYAICLIVFN